MVISIGSPWARLVSTEPFWKWKSGIVYSTYKLNISTCIARKLQKKCSLQLRDTAVWHFTTATDEDSQCKLLSSLGVGMWFPLHDLPECSLEPSNQWLPRFLAHVNNDLLSFYLVPQRSVLSRNFLFWLCWFLQMSKWWDVFDLGMLCWLCLVVAVDLSH